MVYEKWEHRAVSDSDIVVLPDGCRDILIVEDAYSESNIELTDWDDRARTVCLTQGQQIIGFRLCPGLSFDGVDLVEIKANVNVNDIGDFIEDLAFANRESIALVQELTDHRASVRSVARQTGVSTRTLQRQFKRLGLPKPEY